MINTDSSLSFFEPTSQPNTTRFWAASATFIAAFVILGAWFLYSPSQDTFGAIPLNGDGSWYKNYEGPIKPEIQDRDVFYHNIGHSIDNARKADIVFIGHSMLLFGLDWRVLENFEVRHGVKVFNLASAGDGSGEFLLRIIRRYGLHPKLWIINADDNGTNFFFTSLDDFGYFGKSAANYVVNYGRWHAVINVLRRNLLWRLRKTLHDILPQTWYTRIVPREVGISSYRSARSGNWYLDYWPNFMTRKNKTIALSRDQNCPAVQAEIDGAKRYVQEIGGKVILTQVPYHRACSRRVLDIADAIAAPAITFDPTKFTSADGGGHLDAEGAKNFSTELLDALERLPVFQNMIKHHN